MGNSDETLALRPVVVHAAPDAATFDADAATHEAVGVVDPGPDEDSGDANNAGDVSAMFRTGAFADRYRRGDVLGAGGMGEVRLYDDRASGRAVAMKVIRGGQSPSAARRFAREARIQAQLEHPAIVPVYDLGVDGDGALYFTMKRVRGESLSRVLAQLRAGDADTAKRYSQRKLLGVLATVAMAIEYAHRRGVVHRDLKPANIMLGPFGEVYALDWGLAAVVGQAGAGAASSEPGARPVDGPDGDAQIDSHDDTVPLVDSSLQPYTHTGALLGTPGYLAPEQLKKRGRADPRADVYALGALLFELLASRKLHDGTTLGEVLDSTLATDGASPLARVPGCGAPPELDALCVRATRKSAADRLPSAADFARAIESYLDGDRDLARRKELAAEGAAAAAEALARAATAVDPDAARDHAMRRVTTALALDPDNAAARALLVRLLTEPSAAAARAADDAQRAAESRGFRVAARNSALAHLTYAAYLPFVLWMGVRHWWMLGAMVAAILGVTGLSYFYYRRPPAGGRLPLPLLFASVIALVSGATLVGPLMLLPAIAIATGVAYISTVGSTRQLLVLAAMLLVVVAPLVLGLAGVIPTSYEFTDDGVRLLPNMTYLPAVPTLAFLIVTHVVVIATGLLFVGRLRDNYRTADRTLRMQAWQLAQLVPSDARPAMP